MALQLWETLKESIVAFAGLSPATFFTVLALGLTVHYVVSGLFGSLSDRHQRPRDYVQLVDTSEDELKQHDGIDPKKSLLMANRGQIYDVSQRRRSYDVFMSFRGTDVRNYFLGHLYTALVQSGINTYMDSEDLKKGEQISPALMEAIKESQIAIVVFSKDYASSPWCLEEVAKIMECKGKRGLMVFPVFYKVEPREVRGQRQRQGYAEAMAKHVVKFGEDSEKVKRWKEALFEAGSLHGWHFTDGDEAELIKDIVKEISRRLQEQSHFYVARHPVGIHLRVVKMESMLNLKSNNDVLMIGLWGQGGIGKTTLAKALYNYIFREFEGSYFLENIRENSRDSKNLVSLQKNLLTQLNGKRIKVRSVDEGNNLLQYGLCHKKILLVLDDVNDVEQLNALARDCGWFGKGSRIIITTRDSHLLTSHGIDKDHIYQVQTLDNYEALELLTRHASISKLVIRRDLVDRALDYARGLPLALVILGSLLFGRGEQEWISIMDKFAKRPSADINKVLKLSYDELEDYQKELFLDIACLFKGRNIKYVIKVLESCGFDSTVGLRVLVDKSLIIEEKGTVEIHHLIQLMGMDIITQECHDDPRRRSRLWFCDDIRDALSTDMGIDEVKAIVLDLPEPEEIYIAPNAFTNMRRLRMLIMKNVHNSFQGPIYLPNELRWFEWPECPPCILEFSSGSKLVGLDLHRSNIQVSREQMKNSRRTKLNWASKALQSSVQGLIFHGDSSIPKAALTTSLQSASISTSTVRREPLETSSSKNCRPLEIARVSHAAGVSAWTSLANPWISTPLQSRTRPATAPSSESSVSNPSTLISSTSFAGGCQLGGLAVGSPEWLLSNYRLGRAQLSPAPGCIEGIWDQKFKELKFINFSECQWLNCMPNLDCTPNLVELDLHGCKNLEHAHKSVAYHDKLRLLNLSGCSKLHHLPNVLESKNLQVLNLNHCSKLQRFPDIPDKIESLRELYLIGTSIEELPTSIENLVSLKEMDLRYCEKLAILPSSIYRLLNLERLMLEGCSKLFKFPKKEEVPSDSHMKMGFPNLYVLNLRGCNLLEVDFLQNHSCFPFLRALYLLGNNFTKLPACGHLHNLLWLDVSYCQQLQEIPQIPRQLSHLWAIGRESLSKFPFNKCDFEGIDFIFLS